ncbi:hypothetical protein RUM44_000502 [Polyplax serrata]|uniref:Uncharacterized protein n=1 Tax=Polyplax serrata TaxID=468196 RepID=A0ABR1B5M9_POLSC
MDEEVMWKTLYEKIQQDKLKEGVETEHEIRIQELDNGFFERFGTELMLKQQAKVCESAPPQDGDSGVGEDADTPNVSVDDLDSEPEDISKETFISDAFGWNDMVA